MYKLFREKKTVSDVQKGFNTELYNTQNPGDE